MAEESSQLAILGRFLDVHRWQSLPRLHILFVR
jgi:hypothetical protein